MTSARGQGFDLFGTYLHLDGAGSALPIEVTDAFWSELESGDYASEAIRRVATGGWLVATFRVTEDMTHWENHPEGEEILYLLSGRLDVIFEVASGERVVELRPGTACLVPRGTWHCQVVHEPGDLLAMTAGTGTLHRPVERSGG